MRFWFWRSGLYGIHLHCNYFRVHSDSVVVPVRVTSLSWNRVTSMCEKDLIDLFKNNLYSIGSRVKKKKKKKKKKRRKNRITLKLHKKCRYKYTMAKIFWPQDSQSSEKKASLENLKTFFYWLATSISRFQL